MIRFENYSIDSTPTGTTFANHKVSASISFPPGDPTGDFFDAMDEIEDAWNAEEEPYEVVLDRLWKRVTQGDKK